MSQKYTFWILKALFLCFVLVSPYANKVDPALIVMVVLFFLLILPAFFNLLQARRPVFEVWIFLPMLALSIAIGLFNGHIPANVVRGIVPYLIYIVAFGAVLFIPKDKRLELLRWYVIIAVLISLKTFGILIYNGITPADIIRGVRATFYDINSGLPMAMVAIPFVFVCFKNPWVKTAFLVILITQILLGQSKALMMATTAFLGIFFLTYRPRSGHMKIQSITMISKLLAITSLIAIIVFTFNKNPLLQRFVNMVTHSKVELSGRIYEMENVLRAMEKNPFLGRGQGYVFIHKAADSPDDAPRYEERRYTHSVLFYHLAIMGLLGMPLALLMLHGPLFYVIWLALRRTATQAGDKKSDKDEMTSYYLPLILAGFGLMAFNMVSASFKNPQSLSVLGLVNAMIFTLMIQNWNQNASRDALPDA